MNIVTFVLFAVCLFYLGYDIGEMVGKRRAYKNMSDRLRDDEDELK